MPLPADDPRATADEIVKRPLPFPERDAHISVKPVQYLRRSVGGLSNINAARANPMKMRLPCFRGGTAG
jgi:hypothetical protein